MSATGYLGRNVYRSADDHKQPTPVERLTGTPTTYGPRPRALRRNVDIGPAIADRTPALGGTVSDADARAAAAFRTRNGSVSAGWIPYGELCKWLTGRYDGVDNGCALPAGWRRELTEVASTAATAYVYVVFSYDTPIAWLDNREDPRVAPPLLVVPDVRYSITTSAHQSECLGYFPRNADGTTDYGSEYVRIGRRATLPDVDPGEVTRGRGKSPFGPRAGGY
ncbi:hypothetical protein QLT00_gp84 [Gordonia phage Commandaria]|uniref:Uncharacterized protein n=1 Tax=Gordonia phage Commandaria TaxID=3038364 RepID=A0AAF0GMM9_9CAUD|nr:hypothetical protein QLT00_gp84 [Gordonia phage Commandaria]WGH20867.1 hypothetical protein [Gordonia phage Commandaria]